MIAQFFANNKPPPSNVTAVAAKVRGDSEPPDRGGRPRRGASGQCHLRCIRPYHRDPVHRRQPREGGYAARAIVRRAPTRGDLASFKAQAVVGELQLDRAKQLALRQFGPQSTVDTAQATYDQAKAGIAKTEALISRSWCARRSRATSAFARSKSAQYLTAGTQIVSLTDLSVLYANMTVTEKQSSQVQVGQGRAVLRSTPIRPHLRGKITTIEPQIATDTRNIRVQATIQNPENILKPYVCDHHDRAA